jgi:hypothetical protein
MMEAASKFYANVRWCLKILVDHLNTSKSEREDSKSLHSFLISYHARLKKLHEELDIFEKEDSTPIERQKKIIWEELSEILTSGIAYLLLAEIILQESPKSITVYNNFLSTQ